MGARSSQPRGPGFNKTDGHLIEYFRDNFILGGATSPAPPPPSGLVATGGAIADYADGDTVYRAHIFTSSGEFNVSALGSLPASLEYLVIAGGGGGGYGFYAGGGGAGGLRTNLFGHPMSTNNPDITASETPGVYTVTVGAGGHHGTTTSLDAGNGSNSVFDTITSNGGGGGQSRDNYGDGNPGGSGGGQAYGNDPYPPLAVQGYGYNPSTPAPVVPTIPGAHPYGITQGQDGGLSPNDQWYGTGGGGAGQQGSGQNDGPHTNYGYPGGDGVQVAIAGPAATTNGVGALNPGSGQYQWFAGGGGGGGPHSPAAPVGGAGGGGAGGSPSIYGVSGLSGTGAGGGGATDSVYGGEGGSGIVVVRYKIGSVQTQTAKASGGAISFYGTKTIHTFTSSGNFTTPGSFDESVEYFVVGGGGSGGGISFRGGGGGAGAVLHGSTPISTPQTILVQVGGGGEYVGPSGPGGNGTDSFFGPPLTAPGGGMGGGYSYPPDSAGDGIAGGSGGGTNGYSTPAPRPGGPSTGDPFPGYPSATSPPNGWGYDGGGSVEPSPPMGAGGGGAGGVGYPNDPPLGVPRGLGGPGIQIPTTFQNPASAPYGTSGGGLGVESPTGTKWYVAGGGNGGGYSKPTGVNPYAATFVPVGGGGLGAIDGPGNSSEGTYPVYRHGHPGVQNTGSGGGGASPAYNQAAGHGGSGIVLIAYPT